MKQKNKEYGAIHKKLNNYNKELKVKATPAELLFKKALQENKIRCKFQKYFFKENFQCIVDFYIPSKCIVVEIDGGYHNTPEQIRKDKYRTKFLTEERHCKVIRFTNEEVFNDVQSLINIIKAYRKYPYAEPAPPPLPHEILDLNHL